MLLSQDRRLGSVRRRVHPDDFRVLDGCYLPVLRPAALMSYLHPARLACHDRVYSLGE